MRDARSITVAWRLVNADDPAVREAAAALIWERFAARLRALIAQRMDARLKPRCDPDDVLQILFAGFFASPPGPDGPARNRGDLWRILVRQALRRLADAADHHGADRRDRAREEPLGPAGPGGPAAGLIDRLRPGPAEEVEAREEFERLLGILPQKLQEVLLLRLEGHTNADIARLLGRTERTVELKLRAIRELLEPYVRTP